MRHKSLSEYMLGVRQWRHVALRNGAFCVSRQHRLCRWWPAHFHVLFMKGSCVYSSMKQCLQSVNHEQSHSDDTEQQANKWLEILDFNQNSSGERRLKFIASGEDDDNKKPRAKHREHRLAQRRQRRQHSDHKHVQRQRRNTTVTLQMEPMKRGNIDRSRFEKRWGDKATLTVYSKIVFDSTIRSNRYTICTWYTSRISFQRTEDSLSAFTPGATLGFTVSFILQWTVYKTDNVQIHVTLSVL